VLKAWRLTKTKYVATAWDGEGAKAAGGRWNSVGVAVVYTSSTLSLALVETLIHLPSGVLPAYSGIPIEFDESWVKMVDPRDLPPDWMSYPAPSSTRAIGDQWCLNAESLVLGVPSVVVPEELNYLVNPTHADFSKANRGIPIPFPFDPRLVGS